MMSETDNEGTKNDDKNGVHATSGKHLWQHQNLQFLVQILPLDEVLDPG